jgi:hypothetical protein
MDVIAEARFGRPLCSPPATEIRSTGDFRYGLNLLIPLRRSYYLLKQFVVPGLGNRRLCDVQVDDVEALVSAALVKVQDMYSQISTEFRNMIAHGAGNPPKSLQPEI